MIECSFLVVVREDQPTFSFMNEILVKVKIVSIIRHMLVDCTMVFLSSGEKCFFLIYKSHFYFHIAIEVQV